MGAPVCIGKLERPSDTTEPRTHPTGCSPCSPRLLFPCLQSRFSSWHIPSTINRHISVGHTWASFDLSVPLYVPAISPCFLWLHMSPVNMMIISCALDHIVVHLRRGSPSGLMSPNAHWGKLTDSTPPLAHKAWYSGSWKSSDPAGCSRRKNRPSRIWVLAMDAKTLASFIQISRVF